MICASSYLSVVHFLLSVKWFTPSISLSFNYILRRSLRILFALARGTPIVTEEWFYSCLSRQEWVDPKPFLHPHYKKQQLQQGLKSQRTFLKLKFYIGLSKNPNHAILTSLLKESGGIISENLAESDFMIFGKYFDKKI